jgi:hypothetical protein
VSAKKRPLDSLRVRIRRFQFIVGLGFLSLVLGTWVSSSLSMRLMQRLYELPSISLRLLVGVLLEELWVLAALPLLCYGAARIAELRPLSTSLGGALAGEAFVLALEFTREGSLWPSGGWRVNVLRAVAFGSGIFFSYRAVERARAASEQLASVARVQAEAKKSEYDTFLREAEAAGERTAQREAERAAAAAAAAGQAPAPAPVEAAPTGAQVVSMVPATAAPAAESGTPPDGETPAPAPKASAS